MGTGSFPGVKSGRGVTLTPHPLLLPWSRKSRAISLLPLWAVRPVQSLSACTRVHFTYFFYVHCVVFFLRQTKKYPVNTQSDRHDQNICRQLNKPQQWGNLVHQYWRRRLEQAPAFNTVWWTGNKHASWPHWWILTIDNTKSLQTELTIQLWIHRNYVYTIDDTKHWFQNDQQQLTSVSRRFIAWNVPFVCVCVFSLSVTEQLPVWRGIQRSAEDCTKWMPYSFTIRSYRHNTLRTGDADLRF